MIGGGTAGLVCAAGAAGLGARVALVEKHLLGGDCLNAGCVPSKALIAAARAAAGRAVDFGAVMTRVRDARVALAPNDSAARLQALGVDVFFGAATFAEERTIDVDGSALRFKRAVIASGSRPAIPPLPALSDRPYLTNETIFELTEQPRDLLILGAGASGCELAQAFARLGTHVTLLERASRILPSEDADAAAIVAGSLSRDGVEIQTSVSDPRISGAQMVLVAIGRTANVDELGLERAGVAFNTRGVQVDDRLRTTNSRVYAAGDVCGPRSRTRFGAAGPFRFTHAADAMARIVVQNALLFGRRKFSELIIPWCTFTDPEVGHVGITAADAGHRGARTITVPLDEVDRAVIDRRSDGFVRVHHDRGLILGATIVAPDAGNLISLIASVMQRKGTLAELSSAVFPYPTTALALKRTGDVYRRERLTPGVQRLLRYYFGRRT